MGVTLQAIDNDQFPRCNEGRAALPSKFARKFVKSLRSQHCFCKIQQGFFTTKPFPEDCFFSPRLLDGRKVQISTRQNQEKTPFTCSSQRCFLFPNKQIFQIMKCSESRNKNPSPKDAPCRKKIHPFVKTDKNIRMI